MQPERNARAHGRPRLVYGATVMVGAVSLAVAGCGTDSTESSDDSTSAITTIAPTHWTYEGEEGPAHWGDLDPTYATCASGQTQSPIDIVNPTQGDLPDIAFAEQLVSPVNIINNGHTIQVDAPAGGWITIDDTTYELTQFHFHSPSEHSVGGEAHDMELHLVHMDTDGNLAVLGVLIDEGAENAALKPVFDNLPASAGPEEMIDATVNISDLLPSDTDAYRYDGSLTTPPCSENVQWILFSQPIELSAAQIDAFQAVFSDNARPEQPFNGRAINEGE